ncbi:hypothetical protein V6N13_124107 [Hibiscus sabdariffa]
MLVKEKVVAVNIPPRCETRSGVGVPTGDQNAGAGLVYPDGLPPPPPIPLVPPIPPAGGGAVMCIRPRKG